MKAWICTLTAVVFLGSSTAALADQTMTPAKRIEHGVAGAAAAGAGFTLHGTVMHAGAPWALKLLGAAGLGTTASTLLVATAGSTAVGFGIYQLTRGIVGTDPLNPLKMALPGFISGGVLTAIGVEGIVQIGLAAAAGAVGIGLAMAATTIIAAVGVGFLAYGAYQWYEADKARHAAANAGTNVSRNAATRVAPSAHRDAPGGGAPTLGVSR